MRGEGRGRGEGREMGRGTLTFSFLGASTALDGVMVLRGWELADWGG